MLGEIHMVLLYVRKLPHYVNSLHHVYTSLPWKTKYAFGFKICNVENVTLLFYRPLFSFHFVIYKILNRTPKQITAHILNVQ